MSTSPPHNLSPTTDSDPSFTGFRSDEDVPEDRFLHSFLRRSRQLLTPSGEWVPSVTPLTPYY